MASNSEMRGFSLFGPYEYGTAAPKLDPEYVPRTPEKSRPAKKRGANGGHVSQARTVHSAEEIKRSAVKSLKVFCVVAFVFFLLCAAMYLNVKLDETSKAIASVESEIEIAKSENTRLNSALEGMVSINKVEDYAKNVLGMVKLEDYRITYFNDDTQNRVVVSGGKSYDDSSSLSAKIRSFFTGS